MRKSREKVEAAQLDIQLTEKQLESVKGKNPPRKNNIKGEKTKKKVKGENPKQPPKTKGGSKAKAKVKKDDNKKNEEQSGEPEPTWNITKDKLVKIRKFQGETYIDIREYFMDKLSWEVKPGGCVSYVFLTNFTRLKSTLVGFYVLFYFVYFVFKNSAFAEAPVFNHVYCPRQERCLPQP